jgi:hypothetical protein
MAGGIQCLPTDEDETMREDCRPIGYWLKRRFSPTTRERMNR